MIKLKNKFSKIILDTIIFTSSVALLEILIKDVYAEGKIGDNIGIFLMSVLGALIVIRFFQMTIEFIYRCKKMNKDERYEYVNKIELMSLLLIEISGMAFLFNFFFLMDYSLIPTITFSITALLIVYAIYGLINGFALRLYVETKLKKSMISLIAIFLIAMLITNIRTNILAIVLGTILTFVYLILHTKKIPIVTLVIYSALLMVGALTDSYFGFEKVVLYMLLMLTFVFLENEVKNLIDKLFEYERIESIK